MLSSEPRAAWRHTAARLGDALAHRGPDGEGVLVLRRGAAPRCVAGRDHFGEIDEDAFGVLVHRRLSIVDLVTGDQPMRAHSAPLWVVFNGEIYNYALLRRELERSHRAVFRTRSDTEVILECYRAWGIDGFRRLNGMFALALWDGDARELVLARDPLGVKPLYWGSDRRTLWFASELKAPLALGLVPMELDPQRLAEYLFYRFVPAPGTLWRGASKVAPGHALRFDRDGRLLEARDFAPAPSPAPRATARAAVDAMCGELPAAVERQLMSDVPVGAWMSGGLDSSLLVALMGRGGAPPVPTFAVGFPGSPAQPSELGVARFAAATLGTLHHERELTPDRYFDALPGAIWQADEPLAHPGMLLQLDLSALARSHVKVVLTGQGADEPLGGYARHQAARVATVLGPGAGGLGRAALAGRLAEGSETAARWVRLASAGGTFAGACAMFSPLGEAEAAAWVRGAGPVEPEAIRARLLPWWEKSAALDPVGRMLYVDARTSLPEDLLLVGDRMSMRHSLEARVPFLDLDYLATLESLPGTMRVRLLGSRKHLQYAVAKRLLPKALERSLRYAGMPWRKKLGFAVPVTPWFRGRVGGALHEFLSGRRAVLPHYLDAAETTRRVAAYLAGRGSAYRLVLALFVLECWLRMHIAGTSPAELPREWSPGGTLARTA